MTPPTLEEVRAAISMIDKQAAEIERLTTLLDEAREALEPFAYGEIDVSETAIIVENCGDAWHRARTFLAELSQEDGR